MPRTREISARQVHALLAAAVNDPRVLDRLQRRSARPQTAQRGTIHLDFRRLRLFSGLTVKVRQGDVRLGFPLSFRLLDALKISLDFFASYARRAASLRRQDKKTRAEKIASVAAFLDGWLDHDNPAHALVHDMVRHEHTPMQIRDSMARREAPQRVRRGEPLGPRSILGRPAGVVHIEMSCDIIALAHALNTPAGEISAVPRGRFYYVHRWDASRGCVSTDQLDDLGFVLVDLANGRRSMARVAALLRKAGVDVAVDDLCDAARQLADNDILELRK